MKALYHSPEYQPLIAINVILPVAGADYVGPLPAELKRANVDFAVRVLAVSKQPDAAQALVKFMSSPDATPFIRKSGMEPPPRRPGFVRRNGDREGMAPKPRRAHHRPRSPTGLHQRRLPYFLGAIRAACCSRRPRLPD
jgi:hypothetical protein